MTSQYLNKIHGSILLQALEIAASKGKKVIDLLLRDWIETVLNQNLMNYLNILSYYPQGGNSLMHSFAKEGNREGVLKLLLEGANPNAKNMVSLKFLIARNLFNSVFSSGNDRLTWRRKTIDIR